MTENDSGRVQDKEALWIREKLEEQNHFCEINIEATEVLSVEKRGESGPVEANSSQKKMTYLRSKTKESDQEFFAAAEGDVSIEALLMQIPDEAPGAALTEKKKQRPKETVRQKREKAFESLLLEKNDPHRQDLPGYLLQREQTIRRGLKKRKIEAAEKLSIKLMFRTHIQKVVNNRGMLKTDHSERLWVTVTDEKGREYCLSGQTDQKILAELIPELLLARMTDCLVEGKASFGKYDAVLSGLTLDRILVTAWKCFTQSAYEQNRTPFAKDLGTKIVSDRILLIDKKAEGLAYPLDSTGAEGEDRLLIRNGVLQGLLGEGNRGRTFGLVQQYTVSEGPCELVLCRGKETGEAFERVSTLDLIKKLQNGLYIEEAFDQFHALDAADGRFSFPITAIKVENGELTQVLRGLTMEGTIQELLSSIQEVSDQVREEPIAIVETFLTKAPSVLVRGITVS